jgi:hypothetical protein
MGALMPRNFRINLNPHAHIPYSALSPKKHKRDERTSREGGKPRWELLFSSVNFSGSFIN